MNKYFDMNDSIYSIASKYEEVLPILINAGLSKLSNPVLLNTVGKKMSLKNALAARHINAELIETQIIDSIEAGISSCDAALNTASPCSDADVRVGGVLPCPIRIPLQEGFEEFISGLDFSVSHTLKSANLGIDDIKAAAAKGNIDDLPDVLLSAGFELFFDSKYMGRFFENKAFSVNLDKMNSTFDNERLSLIDPKAQYAIVGVVPAIFIVNTAELGGRAVPRTWEDILSEEFSDSVGIPMKDLDLFNAILIHIYKLFGNEGIKKLARSYHKSLHPAQMVKSSSRPPAVSISPYFFTTMIKDDSTMEAVWPLDGAIISPIFLVAKSGNEKVRKIVDFFLAESTARLLSGSGKFPATHALADNGLDSSQRFLWIGWDYIYSHDIGKELRAADNLFHNTLARGEF